MMPLVEQTLRRFVDSGEIAGCTAKIIRNDEVCFEGSYGYANREQKKPMSEDTGFSYA